MTTRPTRRSRDTESDGEGKTGRRRNTHATTDENEQYVTLAQLMGPAIFSSISASFDGGTSICFVHRTPFLLRKRDSGDQRGGGGGGFLEGEE